jgi:hypothetical protein
MRAKKTRRNADLEWLASTVLAATGITMFGHFEEKTPGWRRLPKWAFYVGGTVLLSRGKDLSVAVPAVSAGPA